MRRHGRWRLRCQHWHDLLLLLALLRLDQTLSQRIVVKTGCHNVGRQVLTLSLRSVDLLSNDLALASGARGHIQVGLVSLLDAHVDRLLLERSRVMEVTERADELLVDAEEAHDQGRVEESTDCHAPGHVMVMLAAVVSLATVMSSLAAVASFSAFAALAMAALLSFFAVLAMLALLAVFLVKMTAAVALVNGGLWNVG